MIFMKIILVVTFFSFALLPLVKSSACVLKTGDTAPAFALSDEQGNIRTLKEFIGKKVLLYFYPKDGTSGCTAQACGLRDHFAAYRAHNIVVIGINYDSPASHKKFKKNNHLPDDFILLSDVKKITAQAYGAYVGFLKWFVPARISILIDEKGKVVEVIKAVKVTDHAEQIITRFKKIFGVNESPKRDLFLE